MNDLDQKIDRLLRSAAQAREEVPAAMPFGFDTRVAALWRAQEEANCEWIDTSHSSGRAHCCCGDRILPLLGHIVKLPRAREHGRAVRQRIRDCGFHDSN